MDKENEREIVTSRKMGSKWLENSNLNLGMEISTGKSCITHTCRVNMKGLTLSITCSSPFNVCGNSKYNANLCP